MAALRLVLEAEAVRSGLSPRPREPRASAVAGAARQIALAVAVVAAVAAAAVLLLLLAAVIMPAAAALDGWAIWRSAHDARPPLERLRARCGRSAHVLQGGTSR